MRSCEVVIIWPNDMYPLNTASRTPKRQGWETPRERRRPHCYLDDPWVPRHMVNGDFLGRCKENHKGTILGCFLKWWYPHFTPQKWSFLIFLVGENAPWLLGKPTILGVAPPIFFSGKKTRKQKKQKKKTHTFHPRNPIIGRKKIQETHAAVLPQLQRSWLDWVGPPTKTLVICCCWMWDTLDLLKKTGVQGERELLESWIFPP